MQPGKNKGDKIVIRLRMMETVKEEAIGQPSPEHALNEPDPTPSTSTHQENTFPIEYLHPNPGSSNRPPLQAIDNIGYQQVLKIMPTEFLLPAQPQGNQVLNIPSPYQGIAPYNKVTETLTSNEWHELEKVAEMKVNPYSKVMKHASHAHALIYRLKGPVINWCCLGCRKKGEGQPDWEFDVVHKMGLEAALRTPECPQCNAIVFMLKKIQTCLQCSLVFVRHQDTIRMGQVFEVETLPKN